MTTVRTRPTRQPAQPPAKPERQDRLSAIERQELRPDSLVGSFFHSTADPGWQGCVVADVAPGIYLVELFSWAMGDSTHQTLVRLEDMSGWQFYDTAEWMTNTYEHGLSSRWEREREKQRQAENPAADPANGHGIGRSPTMGKRERRRRRERAQEPAVRPTAEAIRRLADAADHLGPDDHHPDSLTAADEDYIDQLVHWTRTGPPDPPPELAD
jgi:hypothetical protein